MQTFPSLTFLTLLLLVTGCDFIGQKETRTAIAKVQDHYLYLDELAATLPAELSEEDSALFADNYIKQWATRMLFLDKAEINLSDTAKDVRQQLEEYRSSLIIYLYQKQMVNQRLDTVVSPKEIEDYYNNNKKNFELQNNIARAVFVKLDKNAKEIDKIKKLVRSDKEEKRQELEEYCLQHAKAFYLNDQQWVPLEELLDQMPKLSYLNINYFSLYNFAEAKDSTSHYMLEVKEVKHKNSVSPLEFEKENIRNILLNQRKLDFVQKLEKDIFDEAVSKNKFEILTN